MPITEVGEAGRVTTSTPFFWVKRGPTFRLGPTLPFPTFFHVFFNSWLSVSRTWFLVFDTKLCRLHTSYHHKDFSSDHSLCEKGRQSSMQRPLRKRSEVCRLRHVSNTWSSFFNRLVGMSRLFLAQMLHKPKCYIFFWGRIWLGIPILTAKTLPGEIGRYDTVHGSEIPNNHLGYSHETQ